MVRTVSISRVRLLSDPQPKNRAGCAPARQRGDVGRSFRLARPEDVPWVQSWTANLRLPTPGSARVRGFILTDQGKPVGYLAARETAFNTGQGREPVMWIVSAFLIPTHRGKGLLAKYCELLSPAYFPSGKAAARIAADNTSMHRFMTKGGWRKIRTTGRYTDYTLELARPFTANRRR